LSFGYVGRVSINIIGLNNDI
jgi:hypothetical protein